MSTCEAYKRHTFKKKGKKKNEKEGRQEIDQKKSTPEKYC
jgi:hypothetical protein